MAIKLSDEVWPTVQFWSSRMLMSDGSPHTAASGLAARAISSGLHGSDFAERKEHGARSTHRTLIVDLRDPYAEAQMHGRVIEAALDPQLK
jgi:hypothetical protein